MTFQAMPMQQNEMRQLNRTQNSVFLFGSLLMVVGMGFYAFQVQRLYAAVVYLAGAIIFAILQCMQTYQGTDFVIRRLKNMMNLADILFVLAGILMIDTATMFLRPMFSNIETYFQWLYNKWLVVLLVAVILELYSVNRISYKLKNGTKGEQK